MSSVPRLNRLLILVDGLTLEISMVYGWFHQRLMAQEGVGSSAIDGLALSLNLQRDTFVRIRLL